MTPARITLALTAPVVAGTALAYAAGPLTLRAPEALIGVGAGLMAGGTGFLATLLPEAGLVTTPWVRRTIVPIGDAVAATGALLAVMTLGFVSSTVATPWGGVPADALLSWPEAALGYTQADAMADAGRAGIVPALAAVYLSTRTQLALGCLWWTLVARDSRPVWHAAITLAICVAVGVPLYVAFPAEGPVSFYDLGEPGPWYGPWSAMRAGPYVVRSLDGVVGFPSFHAITCVILTRMWARTPLALAVTVAGSVMLLATWTVGAHYLTEIFAGLALAIGASGLADLLLDGWAHRGREVSHV